MPGRSRIIVKFPDPPPPGITVVFNVDVPDEPREYRLDLNDKRDQAKFLDLTIMYGSNLVVENEGGGWVRVRVKHNS
jgi:hypothetical protein